MAVQVGMVHDIRKILSGKIDFILSCQTEVEFHPPSKYKVLSPESSESVSFDSPSTSTGHHFSSSQNSVYESSTNSSSPLSITKELTTVSSPLTPCSDASRSKSKSPTQVLPSFLCDENVLIKPVLEKTTILKQEELSDVKRKKKKKKSKKEKHDDDNSISLVPRNSSSASNTSEESFHVADSPIPLDMIDTKKVAEIGNTVKKPPALVDYEDSDNSDTEETKVASVSENSMHEKISLLDKRGIERIIGPLKPIVTPTLKKDTPRTNSFIGPVLPDLKNGHATSTSNQKRPAEATSPINSKRKRLLSERGEREAAYPVMDKTTISSWNWQDCSAVKNKSRASGLFNNSNDCFLNAVLQLVSHTAPLARYILEKHPNEKCYRKPGECLCCAMRAGHFQRALNGGPFMATWIRSHLRRIFPSHMHGMQEDAHELLSLMLDALDYPVGVLKNSGAPSGVSTKPSTPIEQIFGGTLRNHLKCTDCGTTATYYERIRELNLAIRRKPDGSPIHIPYLVDVYFKDETVSSECKKCGRGTDHVRRTKILRPPAVLLIQLKRFNSFGGKIRLPVAADLDIDVSRHMFDPNHSSSNTKYTLTSVVEHMGAGIDHGHYVAYARGFSSRQWYMFDDEQVSPVTSDKVQTSSSPYLMVYSRRCDLDLPKSEVSSNRPYTNGRNEYQPNKVNGYGRNNFGYSSFPQKKNNGYRPSLI